MRISKHGDKVKVHYTGTLEDGRVFDSSENKRPLEFILGGGEVIEGFERGALGMKVGEKKRIEIPPEEAYGQRKGELVINVNKNDFPEDITPSVGLQLEIKQTNGDITYVIVTEVSGEAVTLDANHPLAGETLIFDVELLEIS